MNSGGQSVSAPAKGGIMSSATKSEEKHEQGRRLYRAVWRWHFYAGIFCIPFVVWLACTGSIYLFKPQIERWLDRP